MIDKDIMNEIPVISSMIVDKYRIVEYSIK
jgi:hypothetical protein